MNNIITKFTLFNESYTEDGNVEVVENSYDDTWLDKKRDKWSSELELVLMSFNDYIRDSIADVREKFDDKDNPNEIKTYYYDVLEGAYESMIEKIQGVTKKDLFSDIWNEFKLCNYYWIETFSQMSGKSDNFDSIFRLISEFFNIFTKYVTKKIDSQIDEIISKKDYNADDIVEFMNMVKNEILLRIDAFDAEKTFDETSLEDKSIDDLELNPGDVVRYTKQDGDEALAFVSNNQDDLEEQSLIRLISKKDSEVIEIDKSNLIEILPKSQSIASEVDELMKDIKGDEIKMKHIKTFLQKIKDIE